MPSAEISSRKLVQHFADRLAFSPEFSYSTAPVRRERGVDPLEDFIRSHRQGHCEFYAAALVLMLRSQGIPARYVVGFAAQEYSPTARAWVVRHQDAHAWVEAWIPKHELPPELLAHTSVPESYWRYGAWLRLDPVSRHLLPVKKETQTPIFTFLDACGTFWKNSVLGLNFQTQQERIYAPILQKLRELGQTLRTLPENLSARSSTVWADWKIRAALLGLLLFGTLTAVGILRMKKRRRFQQKKTPKRMRNAEMYGERSEGPLSGKNGTAQEKTEAERAWEAMERLRKRRAHSVAFFHRLETEIEQLVGKGAPGETPLEFMSEAAKRLGRPELPAETRRYYALRFRKKIDSGTKEYAEGP